MSRRSHRRWLAALVLALAVASCSNGPSGDLKASAAPALQQAVQRVREAAATGSEPRLTAALDALRQLVRRDVTNGTVSQTRANDILDAADQIQHDFVAGQPPSPTPTTPPPTTPPPTTPPPTTPPPTTPPPTTPPPTTPPPTTPPPGPTTTISLGPPAAAAVPTTP